MEERVEDESGQYLKLASDGLPARAAGSWAKKKLKMLSTYMTLFTVGMKQTDKKKYNWSALVYADLFAGPGKCIVRGTEEELDGSPMLAVKTPGFKRLYFAESTAWASDALSKRIGGDPRCRILPEDCNTAAKKIIAERTPDTLYLAFIDPTGLDIQFETIRSLSQGLPCDLIINWFKSAFPRNMRQWESSGESSRLTRFFGTDEWKRIVKQVLPTNRKLPQLVELYRAQLRSINYQHQADPYVIQNNNGVDLYWLWFASKHPRGLEFWQKARKSASEQREFSFEG